MSAIDKIYGTKAQHAQLHAWIKRHRPKALRGVYGVECFEHLNDDDERPMSNFGTSVDAWLARKCPLPFVLERLGEQYGRHKNGRIARQRLAAKETGNE